jgi:hypothetical protein
LFTSANEPVNGQADVSNGDVNAYTPRELAEDGPLYEGDALYVVGRVVAQRERKSDNGIDREFQILGKDPGYDAFVGGNALASSVDIGVIVFALGRIAAVGETSIRRGRRVQTVYVLALSDPGDLGDIGPVDFTRSGSIRRAVKGIRQLTKPVAAPPIGLFG